MKEEIERLRNVLAEANDRIAEQEAHIESLQNTVSQVTAENVVLGEYVDEDMVSQKEIERLQTEYSDALRTIADMQSKWEAEHTDAERYRWLRDQKQATAYFGGGVCVTIYPVWPEEQTLDAHIDAAMEGE